MEKIQLETEYRMMLSSIQKDKKISEHQRFKRILDKFHGKSAFVNVQFLFQSKKSYPGELFAVLNSPPPSPASPPLHW